MSGFFIVSELELAGLDERPLCLVSTVIVIGNMAGDDVGDRRPAALVGERCVASMPIRVLEHLEIEMRDAADVRGGVVDPRPSWSSNR